jgi:hypothetical protein
MSKRPTKPRIIVRPTAEGLARKFKPYAVELGYLVYSWGRLQEVLGRLFWVLSGISNGHHALAIWYAVPSDRTQREMLRALVESKHSSRLNEYPRAKADLIWMINRANSLADQRNDAIHSPFILIVNYRSTKLRSAHLDGHPRAIKLKDKDLKVEFRHYADSVDVLSLFGEAALRSLRKVDPAWPDRPLLPHLDRSPSRKAARRQKPSKSRQLLVQFERK